MTDETVVRDQAVAAIIKGVAKKTALIVSVAVPALLLFNVLRDADRRWWFLPLSVLCGSALGLLNFRWLAIAVQRIYLRRGATPVSSNIAAAIINILKLSIIFIILFIIIKWQVLHVLGVVAGLSLCFIAVIWEGATIMKTNLKDQQ